MTHAGIIKAIIGNVSARTPDGQIRQLFVGDVIYENEIIETGAGSGVSIELNDGRTLDLSENSQFAINEIVATTVDSHNAFVTEVEELQAALEAGEEIPEEETEAGEEDDGYIYDLAYHAGHQFGGKVYSYLFGPGYGEEDEGQDYNTAYIFEQELEPELRPDIDDYIEGSTGNDIIYGYEGNDTIYAGYGNDRIYGGPGSDSIYGQEGDDYIDAGAGDDFIEGGTGGDKISGNDGNDVIFGDRLNTDNVFDVLKYSYHYDLSSVKELPDGSGGQVFKTLEKELSNWTRKDTIQYIRDHYKDLARETTLADSGDNSIESNALYEEDNNYRVSSANAVSGNENEPAVEATVIFEQNLLSAEDDYIKGGDGDDIIYGQEGHDTIYAGAGNDVVDGGTGSDRIYGQEGDDWVDGGDGDDFIYAGAGNDVIDGGSGFDTLVVANETELDFSNISNIERIDLDEDGVGQTITLSLDQVLSMTDEDNTLQITGDTNDVVELTGCNDGWLWVNEWTFKKYQPDSGEYIFITIEPVDGRVKINLLDGNVIINGEDGDDTIYTGAGDDIIYAGAGNDIIYAGLGDDSIDGGDGNDTIYGQEGNDTIYGGAGDDWIEGGDGNDTIDAGDGDDTIYAESANDVIYGASGIDSIYSLEGNDTIYAESIDDLISGSNGNDTIYGLEDDDSGANIIHAGAGNDVIYGGDGIDKIYGQEGHDTVYAGSGNDRIEGGDGNDTIDAGAGDDTIDAGSGDDFIYAGSGDDVIEGGSGFDTMVVTNETELDFSNISNIERIDLNGNGVNLTLTLSLDQILSMTDEDNTLQITGDTYDVVTLTGCNDGWEWDNNWTFIKYQPESDEYIILTIESVDERVAISVNAGDDIIEGSENNDTLYAGAGDDTIYAGAGNDVVYGGSGSDRIYGQVGDDIIDAGSGDDTVDGGPGFDTLIVTDETELDFTNVSNIEGIDLSGDGLDQTITLSLDQILSMTDEDNTLQLLWEDDDFVSLTVGESVVSLTVGESVDWYRDGDVLYLYDDGPPVTIDLVDVVVDIDVNGDHFIYGQEGNDTIIAGPGDDIIYAGTGNDVVYGGSGSDRIYGQDGDDIIDAGSGDDTVDGGPGFDTLIVTDETELDFTNVSNIESIDLSGDGLDQTITLSQDQILSMTDEDNTLQLLWEDDDFVSLTVGENVVSLTVDENVDWYRDGDVLYLYDDGPPVTIDLVDVVVDIDVNGDHFIYGQEGNDTIIAGPGDDIIYAEAGNDVVYGGSGSDSIFGKEGNDIIDAGSGDDIVDGGSGFDTLIVTGETELDFSNVSNIESIDLNEDGVDQTITLLTLDQILSMTDGNNMLQITGEAGDFVMLTVDQDAGWDQDGDGLSFNNDGIRVTIESVDVDVGIVYYTDGVIYGSDGVDIIYVDDIIYGLFGSNGNAIINSIESGNGDDIIDAGSGNYIVDGGDGFDTLIVTSETEFDFSNVSNIESIDLNEDGVDQTITLSLDQVVNMTNDANTLQITGEDGDFVTLVSTYTYGSEQDQNEDTLFFYNHGNPVTIELVDVDVGVVTFIDYFIDGSDGDDIIDVDNIIYAIGYNEIDYINGHDGDDIIYGRDSGDDIFGGDGDDIIYGQEGDDNIDAGSGNDIVDGGSGFDTLIVTSETELDFSNINNIESIDLNRDGGDQTITLSLDQVLDMTDEDNTLQITGEAGDSVALTGVESGDWTHEGNGLFTNVADNTILVTIEAADDEVDIDVDVDNGDSFQI